MPTPETPSRTRPAAQNRAELTGALSSPPEFQAGPQILTGTLSMALRPTPHLTVIAADRWYGGPPDFTFHVPFVMSGEQARQAYTRFAVGDVLTLRGHLHAGRGATPHGPWTDQVPTFVATQATPGSGRVRTQPGSGEGPVLHDGHNSVTLSGNLLHVWHDTSAPDRCGFDLVKDHTDGLTCWRLDVTAYGDVAAAARRCGTGQHVTVQGVLGSHTEYVLDDDDAPPTVLHLKALQIIPT